ncbi:hypothetical protein B0H16DRAFT_1690184 [Mycena metata]|uniref:Uncharacterized protein n=1 Tax=Mycena metata TaxID=1033252 RepID=A0AAD7J282_9AGAR|nr:hypothetical protein B0H16DRAFT_1690184 [Mycena metata]
MWVDPKAGSITAEERREHAEGRRCCGLTKNYKLCNTRSGGKYKYCRRHHDQFTPPHVERAPGHEPAQRGIVRERMLEFLRLQSESAAGEQEAQNRWAQGEQDRLRQQREWAEEQGAQNRRAQEEQRRLEHQTAFTEPCRRHLDFSDRRVEGSPAAQAGTGFGFLILALLLLSLLVERIRGQMRDWGGKKNYFEIVTTYIDLCEWSGRGRAKKYKASDAISNRGNDIGQPGDSHDKILNTQQGMFQMAHFTASSAIPSKKKAWCFKTQNLPSADSMERSSVPLVDYPNVPTVRKFVKKQNEYHHSIVSLAYVGTFSLVYEITERFKRGINLRTKDWQKIPEITIQRSRSPRIEGRAHGTGTSCLVFHSTKGITEVLAMNVSSRFQSKQSGPSILKRRDRVFANCHSGRAEVEFEPEVDGGDRELSSESSSNAGIDSNAGPGAASEEWMSVIPALKIVIVPEVRGIEVEAGFLPSQCSATNWAKSMRWNAIGGKPKARVLHGRPRAWTTDDQDIARKVAHDGNYATMVMRQAVEVRALRDQCVHRVLETFYFGIQGGDILIYATYGFLDLLGLKIGGNRVAEK